MTNFIRTDQEHRRCAGIESLRIFILKFSLSDFLESPDEKISACKDDAHCVTNRDFLKVIFFY